MVDRDGTIYRTKDPRLATIHVNMYRTLLGVDNHNSVDRETVRSGKQKFTEPQLRSLSRLTVYLPNYFGLADEQIANSNAPLFDLDGFRHRGAATSKQRSSIASEKPAESISFDQNAKLSERVHTRTVKSICLR